MPVIEQQLESIKNYIPNDISLAFLVVTNKESILLSSFLASSFETSWSFFETSGVLGFYFLGNIWGLIDERKEVYLKNQKNDAVIKSKSISEHQNFTKKEVKEDEANNIKKTAYSNLILLLVIILFFTILTITVSFYFLFVVMVFCFYGIYLNNIKNNQSSSYKKKTVLNETRKKESLKEKNKKIEQIEKSSFVESKKSENIIKKDNTINITSLSDDLIKLGELKEKGLLTEEEFNEQKKRLLKQ